jgi:hypothetical protein
MSNGTVLLSFGNSGATGPHLVGHVQETGTGATPLPLRDYGAMNNTVDELIMFGNSFIACRRSSELVCCSSALAPCHPEPPEDGEGSAFQ